MRRNLVKLRKKEKLTQEQLAQLLGVSTKQYSRLEAGTSDGSIKVWMQLKEILKARSIDYLLEQEPIEDKPGHNRTDCN